MLATTLSFFGAAPMLSPPPDGSRIQDLVQYGGSMGMFWKRKAAAEPAADRDYAIPPGRRVYAIGDIHGRDDLFHELIDLIRSDNSAHEDAETTIILLGDLVDRGPASAAVIDRAIALRAEFPGTRLLIGNHEECFLAALTGDARRVGYFLRIGGDATVRSYWGAPLDGETVDSIAAGLPHRVPAAHVDFLGRGEDMIEIGDYIFAHAGIRPGVAITRQSVADLRWIRDEFLDDGRDHGVMVVHGHTIRRAVDERPNRIGIDTGAFQSGVLTAIVLEGTGRRFLQTGGDQTP